MMAYPEALFLLIPIYIYIYIDLLMYAICNAIKLCKSRAFKVFYLTSKNCWNRYITFQVSLQIPNMWTLVPLTDLLQKISVNVRYIIKIKGSYWNLQYVWWLILIVIIFRCNLLHSISKENFISSRPSIYIFKPKSQIII